MLEAVKNAGITCIRYSGGNFASGYHWEDGIGERSLRPKRPELAWKSIETNKVGTEKGLPIAIREKKMVMQSLTRLKHGALEMKWTVCGRLAIKMQRTMVSLPESGKNEGNIYTHEQRRTGFEELLSENPEIQGEILTDYNLQFRGGGF